MTKTQRELLNRAASNRHGVVCVGRGYQRKAWYGRRESAAALALRDAGLLTFVSRSTATDYRTSHTDTLWQITDAGRASI
jgi:hypothetical protein